jgi:holo-[acyl-carrier protein] synthase
MDLIDTNEVRESLRLHGERYLTRVYTQREADECGGNPRELAGRFAAKEATMKLLQTGDEPLPWISIDVHSAPGGGLEIELSGPAAALAQRRGIDAISVSIAQRRSLAAALVLARTRSV